MYWINNFEDQYEKAIDSKPECLTVSKETWFNIHFLRQQSTMKFLELYARHYSDKAVIDAFEEKCLVDKIIALFAGQEEIMRDSEIKCIQFCEEHFNYVISALHGLLTPEQRPIWEQIEDADDLF